MRVGARGGGLVETENTEIQKVKWECAAVTRTFTVGHQMAQCGGGEQEGERKIQKTVGAPVDGGHIIGGMGQREKVPLGTKFLTFEGAVCVLPPLIFLFVWLFRILDVVAGLPPYWCRAKSLKRVQVPSRTVSFSHFPTKNTIT